MAGGNIDMGHGIRCSGYLGGWGALSEMEVLSSLIQVALDSGFTNLGGCFLRDCKVRPENSGT